MCLFAPKRLLSVGKEKGVRFGRPNKIIPSDTNNILEKYLNHEITNIEAPKLIGVSRGIFFRLSKSRKMSLIQEKCPSTTCAL
ncbi:MAG: hypothetical protein K6E20_00355 [Acholeplasmatales bacterium]|nr:hypothetical protein [Acholeplasmatales bacterium]